MYCSNPKNFNYMNTEILGVILMYVLLVAMAIPLGRYIGKIFNYEKTGLDKIFNPLDNLFFKLSGIDPTVQLETKFICTINYKLFMVSYLHVRAYKYELVTIKS